MPPNAIHADTQQRPIRGHGEGTRRSLEIPALLHRHAGHAEAAMSSSRSRQPVSGETHTTESWMHTSLLSAHVCRRNRMQHRAHGYEKRPNACATSPKSGRTRAVAAAIPPPKTPPRSQTRATTLPGMPMRHSKLTPQKLATNKYARPTNDERLRPGPRLQCTSRSSTMAGWRLIVVGEGGPCSRAMSGDGVSVGRRRHVRTM